MYKSRYKKVSRRGSSRDKAKKIFGLFIKIGLPSALLIGFFVLVRADFMQIRDFEISGGEAVGQEIIKETAVNFMKKESFFIPGSNIFFFSKKDFSSLLLSKFGRLKEVKIDRKFLTKKVVVQLSEREGEFLWCSEFEECYLMTSNGLVFEKTSTTTGAIFSGVPIFSGMLEGDPVMQSFAKEDVMKNYKNFLIASQGFGIKVFSIKTEAEDRAFAETDKGQIIFNPKENLSLVVENISLLMDEIKEKNPDAQFEYIDARFGNKIFYKLR